MALEWREVSKKGGSLSITIPAEVAKMLDLRPGDNIVFLYDRYQKRIIIDKAKQTFTTPGGFSFSISKELAKKLIKEKIKKSEEGEEK